MEQKVIREIIKKINAPSVEYVLNFEKEWNETVTLLKRSKKNLSQIPIVEEK